MQLAIARRVLGGRFEFQILDLPLTLEIDESVIEIDFGLRLLILLQFNLLGEFFEREDRLAHVEFEYRLAPGDQSARALHNPDHSGIAWARQYLFELRNRGSRCAYGGFDGSGIDSGSPDPGPAERGSYEIRRPDQYG